MRKSCRLFFNGTKARRVSISKTIHGSELMKRIDGIYFHGTAYSHFFHRELDSLGFGWTRQATATIETRLKLLAVFFDVILISRSHLLIPMNAPHRDVLGGLLHGELMSTFMRHGVIAFDARPAFDGISDTERVLRKAREVNPVDVVGIAGGVMQTLRRSRIVTIDSTSWSRRTGTNVHEFLRGLTPYVPPPVAGGLFDLFERSQTNDLPFYQESFVHQLRASDTPAPIARQVCENVNELSLAIPDSMPGASSSDGGLVTHGRETIALSERGAPELDRRLFDAEPLFALLEKGVGPNEAAALLDKPAEFFLGIRGWKSWGLFREDFSEICTEASRTLGSAGRVARLKGGAPSASAALLEAAYPPLPWLAEAPGATFSLATEIASQASPWLALPGKAVNRVSGSVLDRWLERAITRGRRPGMSTFFRTLRQALS